MIDGMLGDGWQKNVFDFYTLEGAKALQEALANFEGGRLVVNIVEMPIKCPVAPLEFAFLADAYLTKRGIRDKTELVYATPLDGAFTKPLASKTLGYLLENKGIQVEDRVHDGRGRLRKERDSLLRRARSALRPPRDDSATHGGSASSRTPTWPTSWRSWRPILTPSRPRMRSASSSLAMQPTFRAPKPGPSRISKRT